MSNKKMKLEDVPEDLLTSVTEPTTDPGRKRLREMFKSLIFEKRQITNRGQRKQLEELEKERF